MRRVINLLAISAIALSASIARVEAAVSTFDDLPLAPNSFYFPGTTTTFVSGGATFNHDFSFNCCVSGWTYSDMTDTTTPGFTNQYSAYPGIGAQGSANYGVAFLGGPATATFATPSIVSGAYFTNTTYTALSMLNGDAIGKKFGGITGNDPDFLKLTIVGLNAANQQTGTVDFYLADYRFANNSSDYIVNTWTFVDLSSLGAVSQLAFSLESTDNDPRVGINTPAYFAMDDLTTTPVPEPSSIVLLLSGLTVLVGIVRRRTVLY